MAARRPEWFLVLLPLSAPCQGRLHFSHLLVRLPVVIFHPLRKAEFPSSSDIVSSDGLLKIAHSPACRQRFSERFVEITRARQAEWEALPRKEYLLFDYKIFLNRKWLSRQQNSWLVKVITGIPSSLCLTASREDIETMLGSDPGSNRRPLEFSFPTSPISY